ncbi:MAG: hypothetical protein Q8Q23_02930 [bacterium]|nr:hypothetical protein [bacterium]
MSLENAINGCRRQLKRKLKSKNNCSATIHFTRIIFRFIDGETALLLTVGEHSWIYNLKF